MLAQANGSGKSGSYVYAQVGNDKRIYFLAPIPGATEYISPVKKADLLFGEPLASSPEPLRVLFAARNVGLIVLGARCTKCEAVTPAVKTGLSLELYAR
jgi:hypothetical protein